MKNNFKDEIEEAKDLANIHSIETKIGLNDINQFIKDEIETSFYKKFPDANFNKFWDKAESIKPFSALGNVYDSVEDFEKETHYIMRLKAAWHIEQALISLKFDTTNDPNLRIVEEESNIGTAGRIAKIWAGNGLDPENIREYGDGRFTKQPRLAAFPAKESDSRKPVTVVIDNPGIGSVCSHHFLPFSIQADKKSKIVISYIPKDKLLGLSKIGRFVEWCLNRPSLQEEVTELIFKNISEIAETESVYVGLHNLCHTCEITRGAKQYSTTTTEEYGGAFDSPEMRDTILRNV